MTAGALARLLVLAPLLVTGTIAGPVRQSGKPESPAPGVAVTGRVSFADGSPASSATVSLRAVGETTFTQRSVAPDDDGRFSFGELEPGVYHAAASAPGYFQSDSDADRLVRPGDSISITLTRGGVITGTVTSADGAPVVGIKVRADRLDGKGVTGLLGLDGSDSDRTDDRGVYRIYGLVPGDYVVGAGGSELGPIESPFEDDVRIFYPSTRRHGASTLSVGPGQELPSIDIRYRSERGHRVTGTATGAFAGKDMSYALVTLVRADDRAADQVAIIQGNRSASFALSGVADGEYLISASSGFGLAEGTESEPKRIIVKGADVTGIVLTLQPPGSLGGQLTIDPIQPVPVPEQCQTQRDTSPVDLAIVAQSLAGPSALDGQGSQPREDVPSRRGSFAIKNIHAGTYALVVALSNDALYVSSIVVQKPKPERGPPPAPVDGSSGIRISAGEKVAGVAIRVGRGAGSLKGRVEPRVKGAPLPALAAYLVPLEDEQVGVALRYRVTAVDWRDFRFDNVAPGKYAIVVRDVPAPALRSIPWVSEPALRESLRVEARAATATQVAIGQCQQVVDQVVRFLGSTARPRART